MQTIFINTLYVNHRPKIYLEEATRKLSISNLGNKQEFDVSSETNFSLTGIS